MTRRLQLMEKIINYQTLQQAEKDTLFYKLKLEDIMTTLLEEKLHYESIYLQKIRHYQNQIQQKNNLILKLSTDLQEMQKQLDQKNKQNENYKVTIQQLKKQFLSMFQAVRKVGEHQTVEQREQPSLMRVKSDLHQRTTRNIQIKQKESLFGSPSKQMRININSYFLNLKQQLKVNLIQRNSCGEKYSNKTKYTDQQLKSTASQYFKETSCFKDLLNKQIQDLSNAYEFRSLKNIYSQSSLRSTWAKRYKENNWLTSR